jgi:hypothetical protein
MFITEYQQGFNVTLNCTSFHAGYLNSISFSFALRDELSENKEGRGDREFVNDLQSFRFAYFLLLLLIKHSTKEFLIWPN